MSLLKAALHYALKAALHYAENGIPVFPVHGINAQGNCTCLYPGCPHAGKHPIFKGGFAIATTDPMQITAWWEKHPEANIGVPTGALSGWYVVDIDPKNGVANYKRFIEQNDLPSATLKVTTGGGGFHLIYRQPTDGQTVGSGTNIGRMAGVNFRGDDGYIVVPPSRHRSLKYYRWRPDFAFQNHTSVELLQPLPAIVADLVNKSALSHQPNIQKSVGEGERNNYLFQQAIHHRKTGVPDAQLMAITWEENELACQPPLDWEEVQKLVSNALNMDISQLQVNAPALISSKVHTLPAALNKTPPKSKNGKKDNDDPFLRLMAMVTQHEFWVDEAKKQFVTYPVANESKDNATHPSEQPSTWHSENWPIKSSNYQKFLAYQYRQTYQEAVPDSVLESVLETLAGDVLFEGKTYKTHVRTARYQDRIYIDLTDDQWNCIEMSASGWSVFSGIPPVKFLRRKSVQPMPIPDPSGDFSSLRQLFRLGSEADYSLLAAWLMYALIENRAYPILALEGAAGTTKTTLTTQIRKLIDPRNPEIQGMPRNIGDLYITAHHAHLIALDNLSSIGQDLSDTLCGIATGTGFSKRALYTDSDEVYYQVCRPIVLNSINPIINFSDLADRSIRLSLPRIQANSGLEGRSPEELLPKPAARMSMEDVDKQFQDCAPKILGALLNAIQIALPHYRHVNGVPAEIRMVDFAQWGVAASSVLMTGSSDFIDVLLDNRRHSNLAILEDNVLNWTLFQFMQTNSHWQGSATELLDELNKLVTDQEKKDKTFPKIANQLSRELNKSITTLKQFGIDYSHSSDRNHKARTITLRYTPDSKGEDPSSSSDVTNKLEKTVQAKPSTHTLKYIG